MKNLAFTLAVMAAAVTANAGTWWSWWVGDDKANKELSGCQLGIASECKKMTGAQVSLLWERADKVNGAQVSLGYNNARKVMNGPQVAVVNIAREGAALQFGLICINKDGFLPVFPFFNFSKRCFGNPNK